MTNNYVDVFIHESSYIDSNVKIGSGTKIWHFSHILENCEIGENCSLGQNVVVGPNVSIGRNVKVQNNVSVYDNVILEDDVFCGPSMVFTNVYNPRSFIERKTEYRNTVVKRGATLGANCTIVCGVTVGEYSLVGAGAVINKDVLPFALMVGVPAKQIGWISKYGEQLDLPLTGDGETTCPHSGEKYVLINNVIQIIES